MNYKHNDYELIYMVREHDDLSQDLLYEKYLPIIKNIAKEFYKNYNNYGYDYDDFFQEGLIAFQKAIINYNENKNALFYTFSVLCIRRSLLTFCRNISSSKKNQIVSDFVPIDDYSGLCLDAKSNIDSIVSETEIMEISRKIILELPFENSCIFELKLNGFTYREIGVLLDLPSSTVEFKNRFSKKKLAMALKDYREKAI